MDRKDFADREGRAAWNQGARAWEAFVKSGFDWLRPGPVPCQENQ